MSLNINVRETGDVVILDLAGPITLGESLAVLRDEVKELLDSGQKNILLNLAGVRYIDSSGLGQLVGSYATVTNHGGKLKQGATSSCRTMIPVMLMSIRIPH